MALDRQALEELGRDALVVEARRMGVKRPDVMTRVELVDEIIRLGTPNPAVRKEVRGWLGVARDLVASLVEQGLNLPDAAAFIRGDVRYEPLRTPQAPVATVTLAEIYGAQGHYKKALAILDEVLDKEPEHVVARRLRDKIAGERDQRRGDAPKLEPDSVEEPPSFDEPDALTVPPPDEPDAPTVPPPPDPETLPPPAAFESQQEAGPLPEVDQDARTLFPAARPFDDAVAAERDHDALVLTRVANRVALYYEVAHLKDEEHVVVRVVELRPTASGSERIEREIAVTTDSGAVTVEGIAPSSVVRAALGTKRGVAFRASAVGAEIRLSGTEPELVWMPRTGRDVESVSRRAACAPEFSAT